MLSNLHNIKLKSLLDSFQFRNARDDSPIERFDLENFSKVEAIAKIEESEKLRPYEKNHLKNIYDILELLDSNRSDFLLENQSRINFEYNGQILLSINIKNENNDNVEKEKELRIYLLRYKNNLNEAMSERSLNRFVIFGAGVTVFLSILVTSITLSKHK